MRRTLLLSSLLVIEAVCGIAQYANSSFAWDEINFLLAFGDSYTFVQGTHGRQNFSFIGDAFDFSFTPNELLENEIVQNQLGTSAGGPNWVEYLTNCFSGLPSKCKKQLWDFAFAGANVDTIYTPLHHNYTVPFVDQIRQWETYAEPILPVDHSKALVAVFIGINDINDLTKVMFPLGNTTDFPSLYKEVVSSEFRALERVYEAGYRNYLFMNLPPLNRNPANTAKGPLAALPNATMIHQYNAQISTSASEFQTKHPDSKTMVFDTYEYLSGILDHPAEFGITNTTNFCPRYDAPDIATDYAKYGCQPLREYFWYNSGHVTSRIHELMAGAVDEFLREESRACY
ncbi:hypothetical protein HYFRA_00010687 [Hymenoscyphus fraxineus]|uniref:Carbohydrate esterase family 16 protein n=1 Tax=Hymenoscyphus fraxineus TaxID=746836 RepID=A0A9N9KZE2_9HELO|nr:hypothetical protein HYFRA_00010687 [Hymenoscyphus fraxineus]